MTTDGTDQYMNCWFWWSLIGLPQVIKDSNLPGREFADLSANKSIHTGVVNEDSFIRELSVQLWSVNQLTTEAEEVADL
jgi:hypothetical protein